MTSSKDSVSPNGVSEELKLCPFCGEKPDLDITPGCAFCCVDIVRLEKWNNAVAWKEAESVLKELVKLHNEIGGIDPYYADLYAVLINQAEKVLK